MGRSMGKMANEKLIFSDDGIIKTIVLFNGRLSPEISLRPL